MAEHDHIAGRSVVLLKIEDVCELLRVAIRRAGTQERLARRWRCPGLRSHFSSVLHGRELPMPALLKHLGLRRVTRYQLLR